MLSQAIERLLAVTDLPEPPPPDPFPLLAQWLEEARASGRYDDPSAVALATATPGAVPSVRMVLVKAIEPAPGSLTFFTNYESRKAQELEANPRAAMVFHWPHAKRQARVEGLVERTSPAESDAYFATRPLLSRIGATISRQSRVIASRAELVAKATRLAASAALALSLPRPSYWGGYRLIASSVELWSGRDGRLHQRVCWRRDLPGSTARGTSEASSPWTPELLSP